MPSNPPYDDDWSGFFRSLATGAHDRAELQELLKKLEELMKGRIETIESIINIRLNSWLIEMKPEQDDSIVGFNEAWDIVRDVFKKALLTARKGRPQMTEWISVENRLPEQGANVLVYCTDGRRRIAWFNRDWLRGTGWHDGDTWLAAKFEIVTHWQPLPDPPKEPK